MIKTEPSDLDEHPHAVWLKDGRIAIDTSLGTFATNLKLPVGTAIGHCISRERAQQLAHDLLELAAVTSGSVDAEAPTERVDVSNAEETTLEVLATGIVGLAHQFAVRASASNGETLTAQAIIALALEKSR